MQVPPLTARAIFLEAIEDHPPENWAQFLTCICADDLQLRNHVEKMLRIHDPKATFMNRPAAEMLTDILDVPLASSLESLLGSTIGRYRLLEQIGEGGMGAVYMASQVQPVQRKVALKIIKAGMDTGEVIARFEAERQALALMNHPNIAKVLDGGTTESGRPYFVMELVKGKPVTEFCDAHHLSTAERLQLFMSVCDAVQHAHQKGIIHRDLKPSNVLVEIHDVKPVSKVIDFGVAKAIGQQLTDNIYFTGFHQMVGTPLYMSPEQAGYSSLDVDTRSDVYSLGVILYELLTGQTPFEKETLRKVGQEEIRRMILEVDPPRPSVRVSTLKNAAISTLSQQRGLESGKLSHVLRGELDWITMKAMEKDRTRRYETPSALAADLQRYLDDEPVLACPPSTTYRLRKMISRHRRSLIVVLSLVASLLLGTGVSLWQAAEAWHAQRQANTHLETAQAEKVRFQNLAWKSGIREAFTAWEQKQYAEVDETLEGLKQSDSQAESRPEWQMLRQELNRSFRRLLTVSAPLHEVRIIPNSSHVAAAGGDGNIYIVDLQSSRLIRTISTGVASLHALAVSTDGQLLATGGATDPDSDRAIPLIYDVGTGERRFDLPGQLTTIESLEFSADGKWLACGARYEKVQVIELETGRVVELPANRRHLWLARSPDGQQLAAQMSADSIWLAEFSPPFSGRSVEKNEMNANLPWLQSMWVPHTNTLIGVVRGFTYLPLRNVRDDVEICELMGVREAECVQLSGDSTLIVAGLITGDLAAWTVASVLIPAGPNVDPDSHSKNEFSASASEKSPQIDMDDRWHISGSPITSVAVSDDWIVATARGGELRALPRPARDGNGLREGQSPKYVVENSLAWSPDGHFVIAGRDDGAICRADLLPHSQLAQQSITSKDADRSDRITKSALEGFGPWATLSPASAKHVTAVAISPDQHSVAWARHHDSIMLLRDNTERVLFHYGNVIDPADAPVIDVMEFSPDSRQLLWTGEGELHVVDLVRKDAPIRIFPMPGLTECSAWSPDGNTIVVGGQFDTLVEINLKTGVPRKISHSGISTSAIRFSHDGRRIISGHFDGAVRFWTRSDGSMKSIHQHRSKVRSIALSQNGRIGASADREGNLAVWFADTGERIGLLKQQSMNTAYDRVRPALYFTRHDTQFRILFRDPECELALRTWDLKPILPE